MAHQNALLRGMSDDDARKFAEPYFPKGDNYLPPSDNPSTSPESPHPTPSSVPLAEPNKQSEIANKPGFAKSMGAPQWMQDQVEAGTFDPRTDPGSNLGRSDPGRSAPQSPSGTVPPSAGASAAPSSAVGSAPTIADSNAESDVEQLLRAWLDASNSGNTQSEAALYWDHVDYYDEGSLNRNQLIDNLKKDRQRWPVQKYEIKRVLGIEKLGPSAWHITFRIGFAVQDPQSKKGKSGKADQSWIVRRDSAGTLKIVSVKGEVKSK